MLFLSPVTFDDILKKPNNLDTAKTSQQSDCFAEYFCGNINQSILKSKFPADLKLTNVTPVYKKK